MIQGVRQIPPINWQGVPRAYVGQASAVCRTLGECEDLVKWFGDASFAPFLPVLVKAAGGWTAITGWGYASAAELQDCAVVLWHRQAEKMQKQGALVNLDELRERHGLMRREEVMPGIADALSRRIKQHKQNPITDPFRQPEYARAGNKTVHTVAKESANG